MDLPGPGPYRLGSIGGGGGGGWGGGGGEGVCGGWGGWRTDLHRILALC